jgi:PhnB protein
MNDVVKMNAKEGEKKMAVEIFVNFNGNCRKAVEFYAVVFGSGKPKFMTFSEAPPDPNLQPAEGAKDLILYTSLNICGSTVMLSDTFPGSPYVAGNNISLTVTSKNIEDIKTFFNKMKEGGEVDMELQETFWSKCYGSVTDKFGIPWQFSYDNGQMT